MSASVVPDELVERIARELCDFRGEQPDGVIWRARINADGSPAPATAQNCMEIAKREARFVLLAALVAAEGKI